MNKEYKADDLFVGDMRPDAVYIGEEPFFIPEPDDDNEQK